MPQSAIDMFELVNSRNYVELKKWLYSPYPEIQAFGVEGMHYFCEMGIPIEVEDVETIERLRESSTLVNTCAGCIYSAEPMKDLLKYNDLSYSYWHCKREGYLH